MSYNHRVADLLSGSIGVLVRDARKQRGLSQHQLAELLGVDEQVIAQIESGERHLQPGQLDKIAVAIQTPVEGAGNEVAKNFRIHGPTTLHGAIDVRSSKNAAVALMCASLLNHGRTVLRNVAQIEEVNRIEEVLTSIGVQVKWSSDMSRLELKRPAKLNLAAMNQDAARLTRSIIMLLGPLLHSEDVFDLPYAGGCELGERTVTPHLLALRHFGLDVTTTGGSYHAQVTRGREHEDRAITLIERGDTVTENVLMAAALFPGTTTIRNASANYMVQDLCFFLEDLGVRIEGIGTTTLVVQGVERIDADIEFAPSEDPIEAMSFITAAIVTKSELTIRRAPIEFLDIELAILKEMGLRCDVGPVYPAENGRTRLVDLVVHPSHLHAAADKIHPMPFPGLNIDNLPFFAVIAAAADGDTLIHDWVYDNRAIHLMELAKFGASVQLLDPHRLTVSGPTRWRGREITCPAALRPAVCLFLAALASSGTSVLRDVYVINRGYEDLATRFNALGAQVEVFSE